MTDFRRNLLNLIVKLAYQEGRFVLSSGNTSDYYIDGKMVTLYPKGAYLVGRVVFDLVRERNPTLIGGLEIGADPIATSVALVSYLEGQSVPAFIVRKEKKGHGTGKAIEGPIDEYVGKSTPVVIVDDVITTGGSVFQAIKAAEDVDFTVLSVVALVDREEGGRERIEEAGYHYEPLFTISEVKEAYRRLKAEVVAR